MQKRKSEHQSKKRSNESSQPTGIQSEEKKQLVVVTNDEKEDEEDEQIKSDEKIKKPKLLPEPLLTADNKRFVLFPIKHEEVIWNFYKKAEANFWTAAEIDLTQDIKDWNKLTPQEQDFIKYVIAFFAASDGIVAENLASRFLREVQWAEARCFYGFQIAMENIHNETYSLLIDTYIKCEIEKKRLFEAIDTIPCIKKKAEWALRWILDPSASFVQRLIAFIIVEGIFFSGSFCAIFWLRQRNLMPGFTQANELISRDEGLHTNFGCLLYKKLVNKTEEPLIHAIFQEAVAIEKEFVCDALKVDLIGMNSKSMSQYIEFVADRLLLTLDCGKLFNVTNPFPWMELISLETKNNFFDKRVSAYQKAGVMISNEQAHSFDITVDF